MPGCGRGLDHLSKQHRYCDLHSTLKEARARKRAREKERYRNDPAYREKKKSEAREFMRELYERKFGDGKNRNIQLVITSALFDEVATRAHEMDMTPSHYTALALVASMKRSKDDMILAATAWLI